MFLLPTSQTNQWLLCRLVALLRMQRKSESGGLFHTALAAPSIPGHRKLYQITVYASWGSVELTASHILIWLSTSTPALRDEEAEIPPY